MGSYWSFSVDGYQLLSSKSYVDSVVMTVFTEAEKSIREVLQSESGGDSTDGYSFAEVTYAASGLIIRDRLEVMGFTLPATRAVFEDGIHRQLLDAQETLRSREAEIIAHVGNEEMRVVYERMAEGEAEEIRMLGLLSFDTWLDGFRSVKGKELNWWDLTLKKDDPAVRDLPPLERFILSSDEFAYRFPPSDLRFLIRAVVDACGFNSNFQLDLSDVVSSGYYDIVDRVAEDARVELTSDYPVNTKIIVLTEGMTDRRVLEASLRLLYPHLSDYYSFMDFEGANAPGGAGQLVNTVKAFAGAGIANRVVALFDNDTAARAALRGLGGVSLPSSMRVLQYPPIAVASNYPTSGPSGLVHMDVNGLAGSLELYFGEDVLRRTDGTFAPVHWRGFDNAVRAYQGEIENKGSLQDKFHQKLVAAVADSQLIQTQDWTGIRAILDMVRQTFENAGGQLVSHRVMDYEIP
jgi:hypothetical protein